MAGSCTVITWRSSCDCLLIDSINGWIWTFDCFFLYGYVDRKLADQSQQQQQQQKQVAATTPLQHLVSFSGSSCSSHNNSNNNSRPDSNQSSPPCSPGVSPEPPQQQQQRHVEVGDSRSTPIADSTLGRSASTLSESSKTGGDMVVN